jgi:hypothetical protein
MVGRTHWGDGPTGIPQGSIIFELSDIEL